MTQNDEVNKVKNIESSSVNNNSTKQKIYIGYVMRLSIFLVVFIIVFIFAQLLLFTSFKLIENQVITYHEKGDIDYKVYLKENNFYEEEYLDKNMSYISTLIKNIDLTFKYNFDIDEKSNILFEYDITGDLSIMDNTGKNIFYKKEYTLLETKQQKMLNNNYFDIIEKLNIDYGYYNTIANDFRNKFGVSTTSNFIITLSIKEKDLDNSLDFGNEKKLTLTIPLSQREVNIKLSTDLLDSNESIVKKSHIKVNNYVKLIVSVVLEILSIIFLVKIIKMIKVLFPSKSEYDIYVSKMLREYDRFIINTKTGPIISKGDKVIEVDDFQELLDVRDNLKVPINYYNIVNHHKALFYLNKENLIYLYYVKANKFEEKVKK